jgi:hypothetical protein
MLVKLRMPEVMFSALSLFALLLLSPNNSNAQTANCPIATSEPFVCSDSQNGCEKRFVLRVCEGNTNAQCCTTTGIFVSCCGDEYQNSVNQGACGSTECSNGGLIVEPGRGRISKACFGSSGIKAAKEDVKIKAVKADVKQPPKVIPLDSFTNTKSRR